jgi:hypothetical protein
MLNGKYEMSTFPVWLSNRGKLTKTQKEKHVMKLLYQIMRLKLGKVHCKVGQVYLHIIVL